MNASEYHHRSTLEQNSVKTCLKVVFLAEESNCNPEWAFEEFCETDLILRKADSPKMGFFSALFESMVVAMP
jgi:hypothetical protein